LASFGFQNKSNSTFTVPVQPFSNDVLIDNLRVFNAGQPTAFGPGIHRGSFWIRYVEGVNDVRWILQNITVAPSVVTESCSAGTIGPTGPQGVPGDPGRDGRDGIDGKPGAIGPTGPVGIRFTGPWSANVTYLPNDVVTFLGGTWIAANITQAPA